MANVPNKELNQMLSKLPPKERKLYSSIVQGKVTHAVYCNKGGESPQGFKHKKGDLIAHIYHDGTCRPTRGDNGVAWLRADRVRTDGSRGFECWCGNDSRRLKDEEDVFDKQGNDPDQQKLLGLLKKVGGKGVSIQEIANRTVIDGFAIEAVK